MKELHKVIDRISSQVKDILHDKINWTLKEETIVFDTGLGRIEFNGMLKVWFIVRIIVETESFTLTTHVLENSVDATLQDISAILPNWVPTDETHLIWSIKDVQLESEDYVAKVVADAIISFYNIYK